MKYFLIAGEASGDLHGANLIRHLQQHDPQSVVEGWGGDKMQQAGMQLKKHIRELAFMGFTEVLRNIRTILRNFHTCKKQISDFAPDTIILIDYPGFNLRMATWARQKGIRVIYYISPQIWAWKTSRVKKIRRDVNEMITILPFEQDFYRKYGIETTYVGHPLVDAVEGWKRTHYTQSAPADSKPVLALFPGSRKQELKKILPLMLEASSAYASTHRIVVGAVGMLPKELYQIKNYNVDLVYDDSYSLFSIADAAFVKSGTSTLEAALFSVPQVVCYKAGAISVMIARWLVGKRIKFISLVNLIAGKEICKELIQQDLRVMSMRAEMNKIMMHDEHRLAMLNDYKELFQLLGGEGASDRAAKRVFELSKNQ